MWTAKIKNVTQVESEVRIQTELSDGTQTFPYELTYQGAVTLEQIKTDVKARANYLKSMAAVVDTLKANINKEFAL